MREACKVCFLDKTGEVYKTFEFLDSNATGVKISIYADDSIKMIKEKILFGVMSVDLELKFCIEEMYLFGIVEQQFDVLSWYKQITQNETVPLEKETLCQLMINLMDDTNSSIEGLTMTLEQIKLKEQGSLSYEDILELSWFQSKTKITRKVPLGIRTQLSLENKKKKILQRDEIFSGNPYDLLTEEILIQDLYKNKEVVILDTEFLFHYGDTFKDNTIYVCLAEDLLEENDNALSKFYFPYLFKADINTIQELRSKREELIDKVKMVSKMHETDIFHNVYDESKIPFHYNEKGIETFAVNILNDKLFQAVMKVPLEAIFKNIHATKAMPYVMFYSGMKQDHMVRLFYEEEAKNGNKIPYLLSDTLLEMNRTKTGTSPHIVIYAVVSKGISTDISIKDCVQIILEQTGNIKMRGTLQTPLEYEAFEVWLRETSESVFRPINEFLMQSGYEIRLFNSLLDPNLIVSDMTYKVSFELKKKLDFANHLKCLSAILSNEPDLKVNEPGESYRYKRVEHFQKMNEEEQFIFQILKLSQDKQVVEKELQKRFPQYTKAALQRLLNTYATKYRTINGRFVHKKTESLAHAGFPVSILEATFGNACTIRIKQIDMVPYVLLIPKYIESILKMSQQGELDVSSKWMTIWRGIGSKSSIEPETQVYIKDEQSPSLFISSINEEEIEMNDDDADNHDDFLDGYLDLMDNDEEEEEEEEEEVEEEKKAAEEEEEQKVAEESFQFQEEDDVPQEKEEEEAKEEEKKDSQESNFSLGGAPKKGSIRGYFTDRIETRDPTLYKALDGYVTICPESQRRQPVLITQKEKYEIDSKYSSIMSEYSSKSEAEKKEFEKNNYDVLPYYSALEYGKDKNKNPLYYVCPRFWCTKAGQEGPLTKKEADDVNVCGKIITNYAKPGENEYVYSRDYDKAAFRGHPSFVQQTTKEGKKIGYPCCFGKWDAKRAKECNPEVYDTNKDTTKEKAIDKMKQLYVLGYNRREPLPEGRHGFIPMPIQQFMNVDSNACVVNGELRTVKRDCPILLRFGVEKSLNDKQSFLACMADLYSYELNLTKEPAIRLEKFREILASKITLDIFVQLQNGTLVTRFTDRKAVKESINIEDYKDQKLYSNIDKREESQVMFLKHCIISHQNFLGYITDPEVTIDHTFLWDVVSRPILFVKGINLVILELMLDDITNKVKIVCPTNNFQKPLFHKSRPTVLLLKSQDIYEPMYIIKRDSKSNDEIYKKYFDLKESNIGDMSSILEKIQQLSETKCLPFLSKQPSSYKIKENITVTDLYKKMTELKFDISHRVVNFQSKIIALLVVYKKQNMYLPCLPSTNADVDELTEFKMMDDDELWNSYETTVAFLKHVYEISDKKIPCKPKYLIVENEMIVGMLTLTNQFVQIDPPVQNIKNADNIPVMKSSNYIMADKKITTGTSLTNVPHKSIAYIYLENQFYNAFRTTMRILMQLYKNRHLSKKMSSLCYNTQLTEKAKLDQMRKYLINIASGEVVFQHYKDDVILSLHQIFTCQVNANKPYCLIKEEGNNKGVLVIPDKHLLTQEKNETIYYTRLADELLRHKRIHLFMFYPGEYLNMNSQEYEVAEGEFLTPKSILTPEYFSKLKKNEYKLYGRTVPYESTEPIYPLISEPIPI